jgi:tetratricopeptide (TPR) repeat protein
MYKEAAESLKQVIHIEPDNADAHYNLSLLFLKLSDKTSVIKEYEILQAIAPKMASRLSLQLRS